MQITGILETALYAEDLSAAARFYRDVLGLEQFHGDGERDLFFRAGASILIIFNPKLTAAPTSKAPTHGAVGPGHVAFSVPQRALESWTQRLAEHDVAIEREVHWPNGVRSVYFRDPAGNSVELTSPQLWQDAPGYG